MNRLMNLIILLAFISTPIIAEDMMAMSEGTSEESSFESGGYGAPVAKMTRLNERDALLNGVKGAWIINHNFALGGAAYALVNNVAFPAYRDSLDFGYGGVTMEYIYQPVDKVALTAGLLIGGGIIDFNDNLSGSDGIYTFEPEVSAQYQFTTNFRMAVNAGYLAVTDVDLPGISNNKLSGFTYGISLNFGVF